MSFKLKKPSRGGSLLEWATSAWEAIRAGHLTAGPGILLTRSSSGIVISAKSPSTSAPRTAKNTFEVYQRGGNLVATPGRIMLENFAETVETSPIDGEWYFCAFVTLNASTGELSDPGCGWYQVIPTATETYYVLIIGYASLIDGVAEYIENGTFGPINPLVHGGVTDMWEVAWS